MKVLFELVVSDVNVAKELERQKNLVKELTKELKGVDEAADGYGDLVQNLAAAKTSVADLTQQQKDLNREFKATQVPKDSLAGLRLEYAALVQQITNLSKAERESEAGKALISQAAGLKGEINGIQESVGNFTGSVGDYRRAIGDAFGALGGLGGGFADQANILSSALGTLDSARATADKFFEGVKSGAAAASDAAKSTFESIKNFAEGAKEGFAEAIDPDKLKEGADAVGEAGENAGAAGESLKNAGSGAGIFSRGLGVIKTALASLGIGIIIGAIALLISGFQRFSPIIDTIEQAVAGLSATFDVVVTRAKQFYDGLAAIFSGNISEGVDRISGSFDNLGGSLAAAAKEGANIKKAFQDLEDAARVLEVEVARADASVAKLEIQLRDRTKSATERLSISKQIADLEKSTLNERTDAIDRELELELRKIALRGELSEGELFELRNFNIELANELEDRAKLQAGEPDLLQKLALRKIQIEQESTQILEKNQNRENQIRDKAAEDAQKRREKENAAAEKQQKEIEEQARRLAEIRKNIADIKNDGQGNEFERQLGEIEIRRVEALGKIEQARLELEKKIQSQGGRKTDADEEELALIDKQTDLVIAANDEAAQKINESRARAAQKQFDELQKLQLEVNQITIQNAQESAAAEFQQINDGFDRELEAAKKRLLARQEALRSGRESGDISSEQFRREGLRAAEEFARENLRIERARAAAESELIDQVKDKRIEAAAAVLEAQQLAIRQQLEADEQAARNRADAEGGDSSLQVEELRKKAIEDRTAAEREYNNEVRDATRTAEQAQLEAIEKVDAASQESHEKELERIEEQKKLRKQIAEEALSLAGDIADSLLEIESNNAEKQTDARLDQLEIEKNERIKKAGNSQAAIQKIEADYEKRKLQIEADSAKKRKEIALKQALIDAALAIVKTLASVPFPANVVAAASIGIATAFQVAAIQSQKFARGGIAKLGVFGGKPHAQGGTKGRFDDGTEIEVEEGELFAVVNKRNTALIRLLSSLNAIGGNGNRFEAGGSIDFTPSFAIPSASGGGQMVVTAQFTDEQISEIAQRVADENAAKTKDAIGEGLSDSSRRLERESQLEKNRSF